MLKKFAYNIVPFHQLFITPIISNSIPGAGCIIFPLPSSNSNYTNKLAVGFGEMGHIMWSGPNQVEKDWSSSKYSTSPQKKKKEKGADQTRPGFFFSAACIK